MKELKTIIQEKLKINKDLKIKKLCPTSIGEFRKIIEDKFKQNNEVLDLSNIDTSKMTNMNNLFNFNNDRFVKYKVKKIIGLENWDVSNVTNMSKMFNEMSIEEIEGISEWDVGNVETMFGMFQSCRRLKELDLSKWDTHNLKRTTFMFNACKHIKSIGDISNWNISSLDDCQNMFYGCQSLVLDIKKWGLKKVTNSIKSWGIDSFTKNVII